MNVTDQDIKRQLGKRDKKSLEEFIERYPKKYYEQILPFLEENIKASRQSLNSFEQRFAPMASMIPHEIYKKYFDAEEIGKGYNFETIVENVENVYFIMDENSAPQELYQLINRLREIANKKSISEAFSDNIYFNFMRELFPSRDSYSNFIDNMMTAISNGYKKEFEKILQDSNKDSFLKSVLNEIGYQPIEDFTYIKYGIPYGFTSLLFFLAKHNELEKIYGVQT